MFDKITTGRKRLLIVLGIALILILGTGGYFAWSAYSNDKSQTETIEKESADGNESAKQAKKTVSGKSANQDRKDALEAAGEILTLAAKSDKDMTPEERAEALDKGDTSVVDKSLSKRIRLADVYSEEDMKINVYQALIAMTKYIAVDGKVKPISEDSWQNVYVDSEIGVAYVPLTTFYENGTVFSFEMVYVDGEWKFAPYSFMDIVKLSASLQDSEESSE